MATKSEIQTKINNNREKNSSRSHFSIPDLEKYIYKGITKLSTRGYKE